MHRHALLVAVLSLLALSPVASAPEAGAPILLLSRQFVPAPGMDPALPRAGTFHALVQLEDIPSPGQREQLAARGIRLLAYVPERAWLASVDVPRALDGVRAVVPLQWQDKVAATIREAGIARWGRQGNQERVVVRFFADVPAGEAARIAGQYGDILGHYRQDVTLSTLPGAWRRLAEEDAVQWIDNIPPGNIPHNDGSRAILNVNQVHSLGILGSGVTIAEWDGGWADPNHKDLAGRTIIGDPGCTEPYCSIGDHPTHVAGTALGNGSVGITYKGMAPKSRLITYEWPDTPSELDAETFYALSNYGASVSQNSWGWTISAGQGNCNMLGDYDLWSEQYDGIVRGSLNEPITVVFSAGNHGSGIFGCTPGFWTISGPGGTAKNTLSVGAVNTNNLSISTFSSRGPTDDGRIKPDLVAGGCENEPANSGVPSKSIWSALPGNIYGGMCGTSMAAPAVSGAAALVIEDFRRKHDRDPEPAELKGILVHTAADLGNSGPDYTHGFGLIDTQKAQQFVYNTLFSARILPGNISHGQLTDYYVEIPAGLSTLRVTLVWDDYPGTVNAYKNIVNDVDVWLVDPANGIRNAWLLNPQNPSAPAAKGYDYLNNVEMVDVPFPLAGRWKVKVFGESVPQGPQPFFLFLDYPLSSECGSIPRNGCVVSENTTFLPGTYDMPQGIRVVAGVALNCNGAALRGAGAGTGIGLSASGSAVSNCALINFTDGIESYSNGNISSNTISNNYVSPEGWFATGGGRTSGIACVDPCNVMNNTVAGANTGISVIGGGTLVQGNVVLNGYTGISATGLPVNEVRDNTIEAIAFGVFVDGSAVVAGNSIRIPYSGYSGYAIYVRGGGNHAIHANRIEMSGYGAGISINSGFGNNTIAGNSILGGGVGIRIGDGTGNIVRNNSVIGSGGAGIEFQVRRSIPGTQVAEENDVRDSKRTGISVYDTQNTILRRNSVRNASWEGIEIRSVFMTVSNVTVAENDLSNPVRQGSAVIIRGDVRSSLIERNDFSTADTLISLSEQSGAIPQTITFRNNTFVDANTGILLTGKSFSPAATFYNNVFANISTLAQQMNKTFRNAWSLGGEGNYWDFYDAPGEGCADMNGDLLCDAPFTWGNITDNYSFIAPYLWPLNNHFPEVRSVPNMTGMALRPYRYQVAGFDWDPDPLTYALLVAPPGMTVGATGLIAWTPPLAGNYSVTVRVEDGRGGWDEQPFAIRVCGFAGGMVFMPCAT